MEGCREIINEVATAWFGEMKKMILRDMAGRNAFNERRIEDECAKKAFSTLPPIVALKESRGESLQREKMSQEIV